MEKDAEDTSLRCSALFLDLVLDEVSCRCDQLVDSKNLDADVAQDVKQRLQSLMRTLVCNSVVFGEGGGPDILTIEALIEDKLREVVLLRGSAPAQVRRRFVEMVNRYLNSDKRA